MTIAVQNQEQDKAQREQFGATLGRKLAWVFAPSAYDLISCPNLKSLKWQQDQQK